MEVYKTDFTAITKKDGSPVTKADMDSSEIITQYLQPTNIPIVGEESEIAPFKERKSWNENWCIDPLDGTRMFLKILCKYCTHSKRQVRIWNHRKPNPPTDIIWRF